MSSVEVVFFLLCFLVSLHACNSRFLGTASVLVNSASDLQQPEPASAGHTFVSGYVNGRKFLNAEKVIPNTEVRILQEEKVESQEYDSNDSKHAVEDAVVMDYAQPHRKPPIHNEEN